MISELVEMLGYCRPAFSQTEEVFIQKFLAPLGVTADEYGNQWLAIGDDPRTMWSSHTDTVHRNEGQVPILIDGNMARVHKKSGASCLGADCTTGVWIMMQMIRANVPGCYIFHRAEEQGCKGSEFVREAYPKIIQRFDHCIAFDRYGTSSIITHQMGQRGCSETFSESMQKQLPGFRSDDGGSYTDSYTYINDISECTNISVGYYNQHGRDEIQNLSFAQQLADWMTKFDPDQLVARRDPSVTEYAGFSRSSWQDYYEPDDEPRTRTLLNLVETHPEAAADLLEMCGVGTQEFLDHINYERMQ